MFIVLEVYCVKMTTYHYKGFKQSLVDYTYVWVTFVLSVLDEHG
jgi:hypothetical protein